MKDKKLDENEVTPEMVLVPRHPTKEMLDAAYWSALAEDAENVWADMMESWLSREKGKLVKR